MTARYRRFGERDEGPLVDGDGGFIGVDERECSLLAPALVSEAVNYEFRDGVATPRKGCTPLPWMNSMANYPEEGEFPSPLAEEVLGAGVFRDADDLEWVLVAGANEGGDLQCWALREGIKPVAVEIPSSAQEDGALTQVRFVQCFNVVVMFRTGAGNAPALDALVMDDVRTGWRGIEKEDNDVAWEAYNPDDGTDEIPPGRTGLFMQNRLFVPYGRDLVAASDYLNYTRYVPNRGEFRINQGSADSLVALYKYGEASLVAFKESSIYIVSQVYGDLSEIRQEELTREFGLVAERAVVSTGADVWFLSRRGVTSIGQSINNKVKQTSECWSDPLVRTMRRVNWRYAQKAAAAFHEGRLYLALPLDNAKCRNNAGEWSGVNNAVLVYDFVNGAWAGVWEGPQLMVRDWVKFRWQGEERLGFLGEDGMVMTIGQGFSDQVRW